jgi:hypothetical protein
VITSWSYDPNTQEFTLTWTSIPGANYALQSAGNITDPFTDLATDIPSGGSTTTATVSLSDPNRSFVRVRIE